MSWGEIIKYSLQILMWCLKNRTEKDKKRAARREAYRVKAKEALKKRDRSGVTAYFDAMRRV